MTLAFFAFAGEDAISIHTLRVEGDHDAVNGCLDHVQISIHTLRVEGDCSYRFTSHKLGISIHTLRVEGDADSSDASADHRISIHTLRVEGDLQLPVALHVQRFISIHTLRVEGDKSESGVP